MNRTEQCVAPLSGAAEASSVASEVEASGTSSKQMLSNVLVVAGPSGVGKGSLISRLLSTWPNTFGYSVSHTTRAPRSNEVNGREYFFVSRDHLENLLASGQMAETAEFAGNMYGTSLAEIRRIHDEGRVCLLEIELEGVRQIRSNPRIAAKYVFIAPPSIEVLEQRLKKRGTEDFDSLSRRISRAREELSLANSLSWDLLLVNSDFDEAEAVLMEHVGRWFGLPLKKGM